MENNENFVNETENVEVTTEEMPKTFTQEDVDRMVKEKLDEVLPGKIARREAKIRKEYDRQFGALTDVLKAGTGKESVEEITDTFQKFYAAKGVKMPEKPNYSAKDIEVLARAEANEFIAAGFDDVVEEVDRLAAIGAENMSPREKAAFKVLAEYRQNAERGKELSKMGVTEDVYNSKEFQEFAGKFNRNTSIKDIYDIYQKTKPRKEIHTMGSMKQNADTGVKDFYTPDEIARLTEEELADPRVWETVRRCMTGG